MKEIAESTVSRNSFLTIRRRSRLGHSDGTELRLGKSVLRGSQFERIAVTEAQIDAWGLPTRPTKASDTRAKKFGDISVELDAIEPDTLRGLAQEAIEQHLPPKQFNLKIAEES
jgi:hypothetical protein